MADGSTALFSAPHGLDYTPDIISCTAQQPCMGSDQNGAPQYCAPGVTVDDTNITLTFTDTGGGANLPSGIVDFCIIVGHIPS